MSDSTQSSLGFLSNWKFSLAVSVPCFAVGLGVTYYLYSKSHDKGWRAKHNGIDAENVDGKTKRNNYNKVKVHKQTLSEQVEEFKKQGNAEFSKQNYDAAISFYTQALSMCPQSERDLMSALYQNRAAASSKLNNYENCVADCNKALVLVPTYKKALFLRARALTEVGNFKLALEDITAVIILDKSINQAVIMLADSVINSLGKQNLEKCKKNIKFNLPTKIFVENYMECFSGNPFDNEFSQTLIKSEVNTGLELALKCLKDKNYEKIEAACEDELNKTNNSLIRRTLTLNLLASFSILRGKYESGIEHLTTIIETSGVPSKLVINSLVKRASAFHQQDQVKKSFEDLKRAENIDPNSSEVFHQRAKIYLVEMNSEKAVENYKRAVELNPTFMLSKVQSCYAQYVHAKLRSNEYDKAKCLHLFKSYISKNPNYAATYTLYAQVLLEKGEHAEADLLLKKVFEMYPENAIYLVQRALVGLSWKVSINEAFDLLRQAIKVDPKCTHAYEILGSLLIQSGKFDEAVECLEKALPLYKSEKELLHILSMRDSARAQSAAVKRLGITII